MSLFDESALRALVVQEVRRVLAEEGRTFAAPPVPAAPTVRLWTVDEVADYLRMSRNWVYDQAAAGLLPCRKLGTATRFDPEEVRAFARSEALAHEYRMRYRHVVPIDRALLERTKASPANVRFRDLCRLVEALGFVERRRKGSHRIYRHAGRPGLPLVNLQEGVGGKAKPYQVRQVLSLIETHGLEMKG